MSFSSTDDLFDVPDPGEPRGGGGGMLLRTLAAAAPILIGGTLMVASLAGRSKVGWWLRGFVTAGGIETRRALRQRMRDERASLPLLRRSLLGRTKAEVAARYGPPRTAVMTRRQGGAVGQTAFWRADTWYYPVDPLAGTAMALIFDDDVARAVEFVDAPTAAQR